MKQYDWLVTVRAGNLIGDGTVKASDDMSAFVAATESLDPEQRESLNSGDVILTVAQTGKPQGNDE